MNEAEKMSGIFLSPRDEKIIEEAEKRLAIVRQLTKMDVTKTEVLLALLIAEIGELSECVLSLQDMAEGLENVLKDIGSDL